VRGNITGTSASDILRNVGVTDRYYANSVVQTGLMWRAVGRAVVGCGDKCNGSSGFHKRRI